MKDYFTGRKYVITTLVIIAVVGLLVRLFFLQVVEDSYRMSADNNVLRYVTQYPARGLIYDRNGKLVVSNMAAYDLMIIPSQVPKDIDTAAFCRLLNISNNTYRDRMKAATNYSWRAPSVFLKQISDQTYAGFQEKMFQYPGFYVQPRTLRKYTLPVAPHLLGYVSEVDDGAVRKDPYYKPGDYIGKLGIEETYEKELRGKKGVRIFLVDVFSRVKGSYAEGAFDTLAVQGSDITSTIDLDLQAYGEMLMRNKRGSIVALEPKTGEVLSLISAPDFDPGLLVGRVRSENYSMLLADTLNPLFNRALMASYPPGSTFKPVNGLIGLAEGVIVPETSFECHRGYLFVGCHEHPSPLNLLGAIETSCNAYFCQTFRRVLENPKYKNPAEAYIKWREYLAQFGFGGKLGTDFINELPGFIPEISYYNRYFGENKLKALNVISLAIGQGEVGTTPLQLANYMSAIANRGYYFTPHTVKAIGDSGTIDPRFTTRHNINIPTEHFETIVQGLEGVFLRGTARSAAIKDIPACGKTGTAQNPHGKEHSVFIAFAPKDDPKIAIAVLVENAGFGATYAAPIASLMMEKFIRGEVTNKALEKRMLELDLEHNTAVKPAPKPKTEELTASEAHN
ncbi:MAG TPA: penicillin-binding protein 2 [Bacteroidales bacterium]|jgi:penicillin-binding protein 2|nr:penicillin-binding protein 2 [Bacteroidales bacterium]